MKSIRLASVAPLVLLLAACTGGNDLTGPTVSRTHAVQEMPMLVQEITVTMQGTRFSITSQLRNTGDAVVEVAARACFLRSEDLRGQTAGLRIEEPLMLCSADATTLALDPGETSEPLVMTGTVASGGSHALELRHAVAPESWAPLTLGDGGS